MKIKMGPTGKIITGHVLDVRRKPLERALKNYDSQLYLKWKPSALQGWGAWEVRRAPTSLSIVDLAEVPNYGCIVQLGYVENDLINGIMTVPYLNYGILTKLKSMDLWAQYKNGAAMDDAMNYQQQQIQDKQNAKAKAEIKHYSKEFKREIRAFREAILSGTNPADIARYWK